MHGETAGARKEVEILQTLNNADKANKRHIVRLIETWQRPPRHDVTTLLESPRHSIADIVKQTQS